MVCLYCGGSTAVNNSRLQRRSNRVWRRRQCDACKAVFTTLEAVDLPSTELFVDFDGRKEPFLPDRLYAEALSTLKGRQNAYIEAREITGTVIRELLKQPGLSPLSPKTISQAMAKVLRRFDRQAYLRYVAEHPSVQV